MLRLHENKRKKQIGYEILRKYLYTIYSSLRGPIIYVATEINFYDFTPF